MLSVSSVRTVTRVRTYARSVVSVANGLLEVLLTITSDRALAGGSLVDSMVVVMNGLRVWLALKQLLTVHLEILDAAGKVIERWDLPMTYVEQFEPEERFESHLEIVQQELRDIGKLADADSYHLVVSTAPGSAAVPGWRNSKLGDVSHLMKRDLVGEVMTTAAIHFRAQVFRRSSS